MALMVNLGWFVGFSPSPSSPSLSSRRWHAKASSRERESSLSPSYESRLSAQEFFESFLRERQSSGDFISKTSDMMWKREYMDIDEDKLRQAGEKLAKLQKMKEEDADSGYLKLSQAKSWSLGVDVAPINSKFTDFDALKAKDDLRRASSLEYEALKRELTLLTIGVAGSCTLYCALLFPTQTTLSYGFGAVGSLLYLQLLFRYADSISKDSIAEVFLRRRPKTIGIRSSDVQIAFEKAYHGCSLALSSPRLAVPSALFGLWALLHQSKINVDVQLAPLMLGFFAYKAGILIQAYRDNTDLLMDFSKEDGK